MFARSDEGVTAAVTKPRCINVEITGLKFTGGEFNNPEWVIVCEYDTKSHKTFWHDGQEKHSFNNRFENVQFYSYIIQLRE